MKDEYSLLNEVEVDFSEYEIEDVNEFEKKRMMKKFLDSKNKKVFWNKKKVAAAVAALLLAINLGIYGDKVLAGANSIKHSVNSWIGFDNNKEKYSAEIGKTLEVKDIKVTLNEFFAGNSRIIITLNINKGVNDTLKIKRKLIPEVYINGKKIERNTDYFGNSIAGDDENKEESSVILEVDGKDLSLNNKNEIKLVFSDLAKECGVSGKKFTYSFTYDSTNYKNASKIFKVDKNITIGDNILSIGDVTVAPDRVLISGSAKGFSAWEINKDVNYYYDIVDENNETVPLKEEIGKGAYYYNFKNITALKIIPYTYDKINTNTTAVGKGGRVKYIIEDKIITINLK